MTQTVSPQQRFKRYGESCPICGGHSGLKQGRGERCAGYESTDGEYVYCTREEYAGNLERKENTSPPAFCHKMYGDCNCGVIHNPARNSTNGHKPQESIKTNYSYYDEHGKLLYQTVRTDFKDRSKDFAQRRPDKDDWVYNLQGVTRVPYRLPELLKSPPDSIVYICEGEKATESARGLGAIATTNVFGAGKWIESYNKYFKGRHVVILPDNDKAGRDHAQKVFTSLSGIAASIRIVDLPGLPEKGDIYDWVSSGGTKEQFEQLTRPPKRKFTYASEVDPKAYQWIWEDRIAIGEFTLAVGDAGVGKGLTISKMIAHVTNGDPLPGDTQLFPGGVILMSPEDSEEHSIVPRLIAGKANLSKVLLLNKVDEFDPATRRTYKRPVSFPEDTSILIEAIEDAHGALIVIDPILSMLSDKVDSHKNHAVRRAVGQVLDAARDNGCALLGIMHTTKTQHPNVLFRSSSSSAFIEMARASLFFVPDPDGEPGQSGVIVNYKNNMRRKAPHIRYAIHQSAGNIGYITWEGGSNHSEEELLNQEAQGGSNNRKSEQELDIVRILKVNGEAMSAEEIQPYTKQKLGALKMMLSRKAESGIIQRTIRGKYTYIDNPLYSQEDVTNVTNVKSVTNVTNVTNDDLQNESNIESNIVTFGKRPKGASKAASDESNISNTTNRGKPDFSCAKHHEGKICGSTNWYYSNIDNDWVCFNCYSPAYNPVTL